MMFRDLPRYDQYQEASGWVQTVPSHWGWEPARTLFSERRVSGHIGEELLSVTIGRGVIKQADLLSATSKKDSSNLDKSKYKYVEPGDLVYNKMRAWQGAAGGSQYRGIVSPAYIVIRPRSGLMDYFHHLLRTPAFATEAERWSYGITSDQWSLRPEHFKMIRFPVPPVEEQAAIVKYLAHANARIDNAIAAKRRLIALLEEQMASSIDEAIMRSMASSESRVIPLKYLVVGGLRYGANEVAEGTSRELPRYIRITDFGKDGRLRDETFVSIGQEIADKYPVLPGDILLARSGATVGKAFLAPHEIGPACHAGYLIRARCNSQKLLPNYLYAFTRSTRFAKWRSETLIQSTIENISAEKYGALKVPVPPINVQHAVVEGVKRAHDETEHAVNKVRREIFLLEEFRTRLVADAVTGQIDVRAIAATLPDAPADSMNRDVDTPAVDGGFDVDVSRGVA